MVCEAGNIHSQPNVILALTTDMVEHTQSQDANNMTERLGFRLTQEHRGSEWKTTVCFLSTQSPSSVKGGGRNLSASSRPS